MAIPASQLPGRLANATAASVCIPIWLLKHPGSLAPSQCCWDDAPVSLQVQTSLCFLRNLTCDVKLAKPLNFPICCASPNVTTRSLAGFRFPSVESLLQEPSLILSPRPSKHVLVNAPSKQNGHSPQENSYLFGIPVHLVHAALTALIHP